MLYPLFILDALLDPSKLLHVTRGNTALLNSVVTKQNRYKNVSVITERTFLQRHISERIDSIFKKCPCCIHYRFLMLYHSVVRNNFFFKKCRSYFRAYLFYRHFLRELMGFSGIAYFVSTILSECFIGSFLTFIFDKRTYCTT